MDCGVVVYDGRWMDTVLIGFDARERWIADDPLWDAARREHFLLRRDSARPLSVDPLVWPSLFDTGQGIGLTGEERERLRLNGFPTPAWIGPNAPLWEDLPRMLTSLHQRRNADSDALPLHWVVAVTWLRQGDDARAGELGPHASSTNPPTLDRGWRLLGYDVADGGLVSGLMNCGYLAQEREQLRLRWQSRLNHAHLFDDPANALTFRALCDRRVPEHAPFFVYGLRAAG